jgi:translocator protein
MNFPFNFIIIPAIIIANGYFGSKLVRQGYNPWYKQLHKPKWTPSGKLIREIWIFLYVLTGLAVLWYWNVPVAGWFKYVTAVALIANVYLQYKWNKVFFIEHDVPGALKIFNQLVVAAFVAAVLMFINSPIASFLMIPYLVWLFIARKLNKEIKELNHQK